MSEWEKKIRKNLCSNCFQASNCSDYVTSENCNETNFVINILKREIRQAVVEVEILEDEEGIFLNWSDVLRKRGIG